MRTLSTRTLPLAAVVLGLSLLLGCGPRQKAYVKDGEYRGTISISGAFALYPLTVRWAEEFRKLHPNVRIDITAGGAGKGMTDVLSGMVDLAMFSRTISEVELQNGAFGVGVAKDAVVATTSAQNPHLGLLQAQGLSQQEFRALYIEGTVRYWGELLNTSSPDKVNIYTRSDACGAAEVWGNFLGGRQEDLRGVGVFGDPGIADAVRQDPMGMGYNNLIFAYDIRTGRPFEGLAVIPIDINGNGTIDPEENFYGSMQQVMEAIAQGVYPSPPARPLYLITMGKPTNPVVVAFLEWILTEGQAIVHEAGYVNLAPEKVQGELRRIQQ